MMQTQKDKETERLLRNLTIASWSFAITGAGGLILLVAPLWFPLLQWGVCP